MLLKPVLGLVRRSRPGLDVRERLGGLDGKSAGHIASAFMEMHHDYYRGRRDITKAFIWIALVFGLFISLVYSCLGLGSSAIVASILAAMIWTEYIDLKYIEQDAVMELQLLGVRQCANIMDGVTCGWFRYFQGKINGIPEAGGTPQNIRDIAILAGVIFTAFGKQGGITLITLANIFLNESGRLSDFLTKAFTHFAVPTSRGFWGRLGRTIPWGIRSKLAGGSYSMAQKRATLVTSGLGVALLATWGIFGQKNTGGRVGRQIARGERPRRSSSVPSRQAHTGLGYEGDREGFLSTFRKRITKAATAAEPVEPASKTVGVGTEGTLHMKINAFDIHDMDWDDDKARDLVDNNGDAEAHRGRHDVAVGTEDGVKEAKSGSRARTFKTAKGAPIWEYDDEVEGGKQFAIIINGLRYKGSKADILRRVAEEDDFFDDMDARQEFDQWDRGYGGPEAKVPVSAKPGFPIQTISGRQEKKARQKAARAAKTGHGAAESSLGGCSVNLDKIMEGSVKRRPPVGEPVPGVDYTNWVNAPIVSGLVFCPSHVGLTNANKGEFMFIDPFGKDHDIAGEVAIAKADVEVALFRAPHGVPSTQIKRGSPVAGTGLLVSHCDLGGAKVNNLSFSPGEVMVPPAGSKVGRHTCPSSPGCCGGLIISTVGQAPKIVGLHGYGDNGTGTNGYHAWTPALEREICTIKLDPKN